MRKILLLIIIVAIFVLLKIYGLLDYLTLENLKTYKTIIEEYVKNNFFMASLAYICLYIFVAAFSIPGASVLSLAGGYFFGFTFGLFYVNFSAVVGATLAFLIARYIAGDYVHKKYGEKLRKFNEELEKNGYLYLLTLRIIPVFPFFLVNIFSALTSVKLFTYVWTTTLGIFPASIVFTYAGTTLEKVKTLNDVMSKEFLFALIFLGLLFQIPNMINRFRKKR